MKKIKYVFELIFTFILPVIAMFLCFEVKTINTVDENNNIISVEKEFNFKDFDFFNSVDRTYINYEYYSHSESVLVSIDNPIIINLNVSQIINNGSSDFFLVKYNNSTYSWSFNISSLPVTSTTFDIEYFDSYSIILRTRETPIYLINNYDNLVKSVETKIVKENFISRLLHNLFDSVGIENNVVIEVIIIYLLLCLIMFIFWNLIYYPLTIVFNIMLWKKEIF